MLNQQTVDYLRRLKLYGMIVQLEHFQDNPSLSPNSFDECFAQVVEAQWHDFLTRRQKGLTRFAKLKIPSAFIEDMDFKADRQLDRGQIMDLALCKWVIKNQHVILEGASGGGKTWMACALANQAIRQGHRVLFMRFSLLMEELHIARGDGSLPKLRRKIARAKLLVIDDFGLATVSQESILDFLEIIEERMGKGSLVITSQLPIGAWHQYFEQSTVADAILDRLIHRAHIIKPRGGSMRKLQAEKEGV